MSTTLKSIFEREGRAFDREILKRVRHGFIPDLQNCTDNDWFRNNPWRRKYLINTIYLPVVNFIASNIPKTWPILDVGCGTGFVDLELARRGYCVDGIDLSRAAVALANRTKHEYADAAAQNNLRYSLADFDSYLDEKGNEYKAIVFVGTLHHFKNVDRVLRRASGAIARNGLIIAYEPARDWWGSREMFFLAFMRAMLDIGGSWFDKGISRKHVDILISNIEHEIRTSRPKREGRQSPNDNLSGGSAILSAFEKHTTIVDYRPDLLLFDRICGGVRFPSEAMNRKFSNKVREFEEYGIAHELIQPGGFMVAGRRNLR